MFDATIYWKFSTQSIDWNGRFYWSDSPLPTTATLPISYKFALQMLCSSLEKFSFTNNFFCIFWRSNFKTKQHRNVLQLSQQIVPKTDLVPPIFYAGAPKSLPGSRPMFLKSRTSNSLKSIFRRLFRYKRLFKAFVKIRTSRVLPREPECHS